MTVKVLTQKIPPLENGDRLTRDEFERRYEAMPNLKKAELINGIVYIPASVPLNGYYAGREHTNIPPLENGDHLTREEFERRYEAMPHVKKAELINGVVYMSSPVRFGYHGEQSSELITWLGVYRAFTPAVRAGDNSTWRLDRWNEVQPDAMMIIDAAAGGRAQVDEEGYVKGAPELVIEIAASTISYDLSHKLKDYQRHGVKEYIVWRVYDNTVDWFRAQGGKFVRMKPNARSVVRSRVFPGLWLDVGALLRRDMVAVLAELQRGLASPEHAAFVARTAQKKGGKNKGATR